MKSSMKSNQSSFLKTNVLESSTDSNKSNQSSFLEENNSNKFSMKSNQSSFLKTNVLESSTDSNKFSMKSNQSSFLNKLKAKKSGISLIESNDSIQPTKETFLDKLRAKKNGFSESNNLEKIDRIQPTQESFLDKLRAKKNGFSESNNLEKIDSIQPAKESFLDKLKANKSGFSETNNFDKNRTISLVKESKLIQTENLISPEDFREQLIAKKKQAHEIQSQTIILDLKNGQVNVKHNTETIFQDDSDDESNEVMTIPEPVYNFDKEELLRLNKPISDGDFRNFLASQSNNGGFDPLQAYYNTINEDDIQKQREQTIKQNIESAGGRTEGKAFKKATKGPSKKALEIIAKNKTEKVEKKMSNEEILLEKLNKDIKNIKTIEQCALYIIKFESIENKILAFKELFLGISDQYIKKIIYIEIIRRIKIEDLDKSRFKNELIKFSNLNPSQELIKFQLEHMDTLMPPFSPFEINKPKLESWQMDIFKLILEKSSILVDAPTSSGKTVCSTFCVRACKGIVLFLVPSKELANQVAGTFRNMKTTTSNYIPIKLITEDTIYQDTEPRVIIATPIEFERYLNLENANTGSEFDPNSFEYLIVDEIHQMNSDHLGPSIQRLIKRFDCPLLGLSATIGNPEQIKKWFKYLKHATPNKKVERISYNKRFINQQKNIWNGRELISIHPLSIITLEQLQNDILMKTDLQFTPKDLFRLYDEMANIFEQEIINNINPTIFFEKICISLDLCKEYEILIKNNLTRISKDYPEQTIQLLSRFQIEDINLESLESADLYKLLKNGQNLKMFPTILFKFDPFLCKKIAHDLLDYMEKAESEKYPYLREFKEIQNDCYKKMMEEIEKIKIMSFSKKDDTDIESAKIDIEEQFKSKFLLEFKEIISARISHIIYKLSENEEENKTKILYYKKELNKYNSIIELSQVNVFAPHPDFTFSNTVICESTMREVKNLLKQYTKQQSGKKSKPDFQISYNDFFLKSIERGFMLYLDDYPTPFQRVAQMLIANKSIPVTFAGSGLTCGVNYPIKSVIIYGSVKNDKIDRILAHQASGRSGRRGLDETGHTIYCGVNWKDLMLCEYMSIVGVNPDDDYMTLPKKFNSKFDYTNLSRVSLNEFIQLNNKEDLLPIQYDKLNLLDIKHSNERTIQIDEFNQLNNQVSLLQQIEILTLLDNKYENDKIIQRQKFIQLNNKQAILTKQAKRLILLNNNHERLLKRLGTHNFMYIYRLQPFGINSEIIMKFLLFLQNRMYEGYNPTKYDIFEIIASIIDPNKTLMIPSSENLDILSEFKDDVNTRGYNLELSDCRELVSCYKMEKFHVNPNINIMRIKYINEIIRILFNQTRGMRKINAWVGYLEIIFFDLKMLIYKTII